MAGPPPPTVGREDERRAIADVVLQDEPRPVAFVLEGDPGIGKTTVWREALAGADALGHHVLRCRPVEAEAHMAYAALGDLLADVPIDAVDELPGPQRHALDVALLRVEPPTDPLPARAVGLALLGVVRQLASDRHVVIGIDDAQWLDGPSERALAFATRRLVDEPVALVATRRSGGAVGYPTDLDLPWAVTTIRLGPLDGPELEQILEGRFGRSFSTPVLAALERVAGGNPFFAQELADALLARGDVVAAGEDLPIPPSLRTLVGERLERLGPIARDAVELAATTARPSDPLLVRVLGVTGAAEALREATEAEILERDGERIRFTHPLIASVAAQRGGPDERRARHLRLAEAADEPEQRARHLALATEVPDTAIAAALDRGAETARLRGAHDLAADLLLHAHRLTPSDEPAEALRRRREAAARHFDAGNVDRATELLAESMALAPAGAERARVQLLRGTIRGHTEGPAAGAESFLEGLAEAGDDIALRVVLLNSLAWCVQALEGVARGAQHARVALRLAEELGDAHLLAVSLTQAAYLDAKAGQPGALEALEQAMAIRPTTGWTQILGRADWVHTQVLQWSGHLEEAGAAFSRLHREAVERGDDVALPFVLFGMAQVDLLTGAWERAGVHADACWVAARGIGTTSDRTVARTIRAMVDAHRGRVAAADVAIDEGLALARSTGNVPASWWLLAIRGFLQLSVGRPGEAAATLAGLADELRRDGVREPALYRFHGDAIEAAVAVGDALDRHGGPARPGPRAGCARRPRRGHHDARGSPP
jgi:tetratricopeptide (TPR) repeat protein